jgi:RNA polymerase sigma-70 factor (ECF subfamily)
MTDDAQLENDIHERLLAGDPTAPQELARKYLPLIERHVSARAHGHGIYDQDLINDATVDAVFGYIRHPEKFNPNKSGLLGYLKLASEMDLINVVQQDRRRRRGEELQEDVEVSILARNKSSEIDRIRRGAEDEMISRIQQQRNLAEITGAENDRDKILLHLMAEGERSTSRFAAVLGITDLPIAEQRHVVKRNKDRLKAHLRRGRSKSRA